MQYDTSVAIQARPASPLPAAPSQVPTQPFPCNSCVLAAAAFSLEQLRTASRTQTVISAPLRSCHRASIPFLRSSPVLPQVIAGTPGLVRFFASGPSAFNGDVRAFQIAVKARMADAHLSTFEARARPREAAEVAKSGSGWSHREHEAQRRLAAQSPATS